MSFFSSLLYVHVGVTLSPELGDWPSCRWSAGIGPAADADWCQPYLNPSCLQSVFLCFCCTLDYDLTFVNSNFKYAFSNVSAFAVTSGVYLSRS